MFTDDVICDARSDDNDYSVDSTYDARNMATNAATDDTIADPIDEETMWGAKGGQSRTSGEELVRLTRLAEECG